MMTGKIRELPKSSSRLLSSSQIISSVYSVVKELVENALDIESKNVEVKLENYGLEKIEVRDNGHGIHKEDVPFVAKPHFTSKITDHLDLIKIQTYGFRGEALGAICAVADLFITTKTSDDDIGVTYGFDHKGDIISTKLCSCAQGTIVAVLNLFQNVPVRKKYYRAEKNKKEELKQIEDLLISFGCVKFDVRFVLYHNKALIWQKSVASNVKEAMIQILGNSVVDYMEYFDIVDEQSETKMEIFLPKHNSPVICSHISSCRCIVVINKRPVRIKEIDKLLKEYYSRSTVNLSKPRYPVCYVSLTLPPSKVDVNIEPNKTNVLIHNLDKILEQLEEILKKSYDVSSSNNVVQGEGAKTLQTFEMEFDIANHKNAFKPSTILTNPQIQSSEPAPSPVVTKVPKKNPITGKVIHLESLETPAKRRKTASKSINDIHNHINTMETFFSSSGNDIPEKSNSNLNITPTNINNPLKVTVERSSEMDESGKLISVAENEASDFFKISERKRHLSDPCISMSQNEKSGLQALSSTNNKAALWSIGLHPSGKQIEPVSVLRPKLAETANICKTVPDAKGSSNTSSIEGNSNVTLKKQLAAKNVPNAPSFEKKMDKNQAVNTLPLERKLSAFDIFCRQNRFEIAAENPNCTSAQVAQILTEKWTHLSPEEKTVYKSIAVKDYPKNIKNKEKLGKTVSQNLIKSTKNPAKNPKEKLKQKTLFFDLEALKNDFFNPRSDLRNGDLNIINYLTPGIWICSENEKISLLNSFRLQETIIYYRLLNTYHFETEPIIPPTQVAVSALGGDDILKTLLQLNGGNINNNEYLNDERLIANGFKIAVKQDENNIVIEILEVTKDISFYGIADLREILILIMEKGYSTKLSDCRPGKITLYLQGEAVRIARQSHPSQRVQDIKGILDQRKSLPPNCEKCIHCKPFFSELWQKNAS